MLNKTAEPEIMRFLDGQFEMNKVQVVLSASLIVGFVQVQQQRQQRVFEGIFSTGCCEDER